MLSAKVTFRITNLVKFHVSSGKSEILSFGGHSCFRNHIKFQLKKYRRVISHDTEEWYKVLKKDWLAVSNMTWRIWWVFTQPLKSLKISFWWLFLSKVYKVRAIKIQRSYLSWHWIVMQNLNKPWPCCFKNGMRNWVNFQ